MSFIYFVGSADDLKKGKTVEVATISSLRLRQERAKFNGNNIGKNFIDNNYDSKNDKR